MEQFDVLYSSEQIQRRIHELGDQITEDYRGKDLLVLGVLTGAFIFMADLVRSIKLPLRCAFMRISSYGSGKVSSGKIDMLLDVSEKQVKEKHILLVEDIVDTGNSIVFLKKHLQQYQPSDIKVCSLLLKKSQLQNEVIVDYLGFAIDPLFVIGYGLDLNERFRNFPEIQIHP